MRIACLALTGVLVVPSALSQETSAVSAADRAFEDGQWALAIDEYRGLAAKDASNGLLWLRIAQAERELGQHALALEILQKAREGQAPEAMIELERARDLGALNQADAAMRALEAADHLGLRALDSVEEAPELDSLRDREAFQRVHRSIRRRVYPCEGISAARAFDFWIGSWEVRLDDGTLVGKSQVSRGEGGCSIVERWDGAGGSTGTSINYYQPSSDQWHQLWVGSNGTLIDVAGSFRDGAMRLEGTIEYIAQERIEAFRGTWSVLPDGRVRQHLEEFSLVAQSWQTWFDGYYRLLSRQ